MLLRKSRHGEESRRALRSCPPSMESKAGSKFLFYLATLSKSRFTFFRTHSRGTAALEFGLAVPLLALLLTAIVEIGFSMYQAMQANYAAEAGLAYAAKNGWDSSGIASAATGSTGLSGMTATPTQFCGCASYTGLATATCGATCSGGGTAGQYIRNQRLAHAHVDHRHDGFRPAVQLLGAIDPEAELAPWRRDRISM